MQRPIALLLVALLALTPCAATAADFADNAAIIAAAKAYLREHNSVKSPKIEVEAVAKGFPRAGDAE